MNPKLAAISAMIILLGLGVATWISAPSHKSASKLDLICNVIHEPKQGCPAGYAKEAKPRFTEKDGSKQFACVDQTGKKPGCFDVLKPGEGVEMIFELKPEPPDGGPKT